MKSIILFLLISAIYIPTTPKKSNFDFKSNLGACTGNVYCNVCTNCTKCAYCNSGGSCGVCMSSLQKKQTLEKIKIEAPKFVNISNGNGEIYEGYMVNGKKQGYGVYTNQDAFKYEGNWKDDKMNGQGTMIFLGDTSDEEGNSLYDKYTGNFFNNFMHGYGVIEYGNGDVYEGNFFESKRHGYGVLTTKDGEIIKGNWKNDEFVK